MDSMTRFGGSRAWVVTAVTVVASVAGVTSAAALTVPGAPTGLAGYAGKPVAKATLTWVAPVDTGGGIATYLYDVATDYNSGTGTGTWSGLVNLNRKGTQAPVPCAAVYPAVCTYRLYAQNSAGTSAPSVPFTVQWTVPTNARSLNATTTNFSDVSLTWKAPANTGGLAVRYDAQVSNNSGQTWVTLVTDLTVRNYFAPGSCTSGSKCQYRVWAKNAVGTAAKASNVYTIKLAPGYITALSASKTADDVTTGNAASGSGTMLVTWSAATTGLADGPDQLQQCLGVCASLAFNWSASVSIPNGTLTATRTCPAAAIGCSFRVRATNTRGGAGVWAYVVYKPTAPVGVSATTGTASSSVSVTFSGPSEPGPAALSAHYRFLVCATDCGASANWSTSATTVPYPPATQPSSADVVCPLSGASCSVRAQFVNDNGRTSMVSAAAIATAAP